MADPLYLGVNELGIQVWEIEEGGMRPLVDKEGKIKCEWCEEVKLPIRIGLTRGRRNVEWALLACPDCGMAHCVMKVKLYRSTADVPRLTKEQIDGLTFQVGSGVITPDGEAVGQRKWVSKKEMTGGKLHYTDPKERAKAGVEMAVESLQRDRHITDSGQHRKVKRGKS